MDDIFIEKEQTTVKCDPIGVVNLDILLFCYKYVTTSWSFKPFRHYQKKAHGFNRGFAE